MVLEMTALPKTVLRGNFSSDKENKVLPSTHSTHPARTFRAVGVEREKELC